MSTENLSVRFESPEALRREFEKNIANRGVFVPTELSLEVRQPIVIDVVLDYLDPAEPALSLEGEVVHCVPVEMAGSGATPGVAVQFDASAASLRERFEELLGREAVAASKDDTDGAGRRSAKRGTVRVPVRVMPENSAPFEATSRDLSASGILLSVRDTSIAIGETVRICLWHPSGDPSVELDGKAVRHIPNKSGEIAAVAIAFDTLQMADPTAVEVIASLRESGHRSRLGGIAGSIADLGLPNMLQMFGTSAPQGTVVIEHEGEQGWVAFADGNLLGAEVGSLSGLDAIVAMLAWGDGQFQFEATADPKLVAGAKPWPLDGAVMDAVCRLDEEAEGAAEPEGVSLEPEASAEYQELFESEDLDVSIELDLEPEPECEPVVELEAQPETIEPDDGLMDLGDLSDAEEAGMPPSVVELTSSTTFEVDLDQEEMSRDGRDKTEDAILDLVKAGLSLERLFEVIPEPEERIEAALIGLVEVGVLLPR